jgi:hypothetical protein
MTTSDESAVNEVIKDTLKALQGARDLSERARYGSVVGHLADAQREASYALYAALGRN